jgi:hypothetical protein
MTVRLIPPRTVALEPYMTNELVGRFNAPTAQRIASTAELAGSHVTRDESVSVMQGRSLRRDSEVSVMSFEELHAGESSATLWSTGPIGDFGSTVCGVSPLFVRRARRVCATWSSTRDGPKAVRIVSRRPSRVGLSIRRPGGGGKPQRAAVG